MVIKCVEYELKPRQRESNKYMKVFSKWKNDGKNSKWRVAKRMMRIKRKKKKKSDHKKSFVDEDDDDDEHKKITYEEKHL